MAGVAVDRSTLVAAAAAAAAGQQYPAGALYLVATPIGNLADLTFRALHVLAIADAIACEDTRHTQALLGPFGITGKPLIAAHAHNEREAAEAVVVRLGRGERVAYASDAGTPGISDPGARLVVAARDAGHAVVPIPGASSVVAALSIAGDPEATGFRFVGFLPARGGERQRQIDTVAASADAQVVFEAPHRIAGLVAALAEAMPDRRITVARELTKQFETIATMPAAAAPAWLAFDPARRRGEFVVVVHAAPRPLPGAADAGAVPSAATRTLELLLRELPLRQAVDLATAISGAPRNALYELALTTRRTVPGE